ncbi:MAG: ATP-dependent RNA helicase HrpA [Zoogloeaceae bacterium]|jgi:ATP-dependent helicase HrpA|nr:ATP-dependent RNA helicase HrpA [Zoogloeaceae bacterium]
MPSQPPGAAALSFADCLARDRPRLLALWREGRQAAAFSGLLVQSRAAHAARRKALPHPEFADDLPVHAKRGEIADLIARHPVVIVCGETGSGKTTQLPKICLELGRGAAGLIGHTQPRRLAARSVASRLAQELQTQVGAGVGLKIRFHDRTSPESWIKLMTDGILLAETQGDPLLTAYDTIIIDEAHERSLNIDFLLGYLKEILPRRPDLKLIVTSATIDAERFARHFGGGDAPAPVIEVSGRLYPVDVRYRPVDAGKDDDERDRYAAIADACDELARLGDGDILVFLPGEREIREAAKALRKRHFSLPAGKHAEILPLFSRLSAAEQDRIFRSSGTRRIVLSTNVAETSLTVPGIRYVVDTGLARVKRYSWRNKVEQLRVEKISQAAARQRAGRCGRVAAGVCVRLYDEADFLARPAFTDPEILRASLAGVILRMKSLRLTEVAQFPFLEAPKEAAINDGYSLLRELGALDEHRNLTETGGMLARLPLDPRIARMLMAAKEGGCLAEMLVIAAALSTQDPRERPQDKQQAADEAHRRILFPAGKAEQSEFLGWLRLWAWYAQEIEHKKSNKKLIERCHAHFLSYLRLREWRETHSQLRALTAEMGWRENELPAGYPVIHKALLAGLLGNLGRKADEGGYYLGARGIRFLPHPASFLHKRAGKWILAAEITETTRLYGRCIANIEAEWLEEVGAHLIKKSCFDPHWEKKAMQVAAWERVTLHGVVIHPKRRVHYGPMCPAEGREIFIRQALVGGEVEESHARRWDFWRHNRKLVRDIEQLEHKQRRQDVLVDDEPIFAFYDKLIPEGIHNGASFDYWRKEAERENPRLLYLQRNDLMRHQAAGVTTLAFPRRLLLAGVEYPLAYHFEPGSPRDGVTLTVPLAHLNPLSASRLEWLVPGLLKEKLIALIKTLPQKIRARLVPVPEFVESFIASIHEDEQRMGMGILPPLIDFIRTERGLTPDAFRLDALPAHFFMNYKLVDAHGRQLDMRRDLGELKAQWGSEARQTFAELHATPSAYSGLTGWTFGELPELLEIPSGKGRVIGYPALMDDGDSVRLQVFDDPEEARRRHAFGLTRLFMLQLAEQRKSLEKNLPDFSRMAMQYMRLGTADELKTQLLSLVFTRACLGEKSDAWPRNAAEFQSRVAAARPRIGLLAQEITRLVSQILEKWQTLDKKLSACKGWPAAVADIEAQIERLMTKTFIADTPFARLQHFPRYLRAIELRLDKLKTDPARDARLLAEYQPLWAQCERRVRQLARQNRQDSKLEQFRWLLEELRVSLFAQELKTPAPVSVKRLQKMWEAGDR